MKLKAGQYWRHYKGDIYKMLVLSKHSETGEEFVTYKRQTNIAHNGNWKTYTRPLSLFFSTEEWKGETVPRFVQVYPLKFMLLEAFGWYGAIAVLIAYALVTFGYFSPMSFWFQFLNATGSAGLTTIAYIKKDWQLAMLNLVWVLIALIALIHS